jgi:putative transposase
LDAALLRKRDEVYQAARAAQPERRSGNTRNWKPVYIVHLNPNQTSSNATEVEENELLKKAA